jgi:hypothetical protein
MDIEQVYNTIDKIITAQKKARIANDYNTILLNCEALLEYMPQLIIYSVEQESEYRRVEFKVSNDESVSQKDGDKVIMKKNTSAYAEVAAKSSEHYKNWQKSKQFIELLYEMVQMGKKLAGSVDNELKAH